MTYDTLRRGMTRDDFAKMRERCAAGKDGPYASRQTMTRDLLAVLDLIERINDASDDLIYGLRRRAAADDLSMVALLDMIQQPSGIYELWGILNKARIDRLQAADRLALGASWANLVAGHVRQAVLHEETFIGGVRYEAGVYLVQRIGDAPDPAF